MIVRTVAKRTEQVDYMSRPAILALIMTSISLALLGLMLWLRSRIPAVPDLYNLVYDGSRPAKPEGTTAFLLMFPGFCLAASFVVPYSLQAAVRRGDRRIEAKLV